MLDINADIALQIGENRTIELVLSNVGLTGFNVTVDNCYVKKDESGIMTRLNAVMAAVQASVNTLVKNLAPKLPEFSTINYDISFDYQDKAFGTGIMVSPK